MLIAICDDNQSCIDELEMHVREYLGFDIHTYSTGADLLEAHAQKKYDIIFLDIDMPEMTGMELAARIRQIDKHVQIIFVTYMEDQLPHGYRFKASGFVVKPFTAQRIHSVLDDAMTWIKAGNLPPVEVKIKGGGISWLDTREILYIESHRHYMEAVNQDGSRLEFLGKITTLETELREHNFARIHRSYLVNLAYVFIRNPDSVRLTCGQMLPIGRSYTEKFKARYEKYRSELLLRA